LESLFLQQKQDLDQVTCKLLRVAHPGLATEIYHRLLNQEASFEQLSMQFGVGPERFHGGLLKRQYVKDLPKGLGQLLVHLDSGELMKPLKFSNKFVVLQLIERIAAVFDESTKQLLLSKELQNWIQGMSGCLRAQLGLPNA
jgi:parvulin-like peptidyl-prolyl isomerase